MVHVIYIRFGADVFCICGKWNDHAN
jgi:hypothetical protein